jgi:hypothetical protein
VLLWFSAEREMSDPQISLAVRVAETGDTASVLWMLKWVLSLIPGHFSFLLVSSSSSFADKGLEQQQQPFVNS